MKQDERKKTKALSDISRQRRNPNE